ncbi:MAG: beta-hydroxylase [Hyphomicrobiales bacterium]|nr:MAG: beta-hydroxylase [Hyphomicrobiales bacterium]
MDPDPPYLIQLNERLAEPLADWPTERIDRFAAFIRSRQTESGGFAGRAGGAALYYTAFAVRSLSVLGRLDPGIGAAVAGFGRALRPANLIDIVSCLAVARMLGCDWGPEPAEMAAGIESFRGADGGYGKVPGASSSSTYHTFLAALSYDLLGRRQPGLKAVGEFVLSRLRDDGGFAEIGPIRGGSVNPTAAGAAMVMALALDAGAGLDEDAIPAILDGVVGFLLSTQRDDGGWPASPRTPASDLLSTLTALLTLSDLESLADADTAKAGAFVGACEVQADRFGGYPGDEEGDVEYTFYGLGASAILGL